MFWNRGPVGVCVCVVLMVEDLCDGSCYKNTRIKQRVVIPYLKRIKTCSPLHLNVPALWLAVRKHPNKQKVNSTVWYWGLHDSNDGSSFEHKGYGGSRARCGRLTKRSDNVQQLDLVTVQTCWKTNCCLFRKGWRAFLVRYWTQNSNIELHIARY